MNQLVKAFTKSILAGDVPALLELHSSSIDSKIDNFTFYEKIIKPSMYRIGELWEKNQITVADEHLATATLKYLLATIFTHQEALENQPKALLFCIEGEHHSLGLELANEVFKEKQWNTRYLGANVPVKDALTFISVWKPHAIGISIGMTTELTRLKECIQEIRAHHKEIDILVGGRLVSHYSLDFLEKSKVTSFYDLLELNEYLDDMSNGLVSLKG
ncbi:MULTISPECIES: cobalamin B12-binding domain-containing protein [Rossellomorea]|uniref:cobalamin B12-binding domain-containing protein n=1 Tax=Rossellomorea TaxID=2837508 RepID=UPI001CCFC44A|nr:MULTISPECIES: cobalamin B12-binding domain-containing protein [Rossellomorea]MCA0150014.1 cobalamin B12-binding domain-containing protein [Rossellomorea vietnamensis]UTE78208.1 cobalamin B12-binding domain-containing protein [Rossellomorea sp. KS-H15a]WGG46167.1 cobalamin B12-binding domain-containing protein [Rossellomorea sp. DA94]